MKIQITELPESTVANATEALDRAGYKYDEDFTTLYGAQWAVVGLEFTNVKAAELALGWFRRMEEIEEIAAERQLMAQRERERWEDAEARRNGTWPPLRAR